MGFLDYMFDSEWRQRDDIDDAAREAANARFYGDLALKNVEQLRAKVIEQREEIRDLTVTMSVLVKMLGETGALDDKVLRYRVEAELEAMAEAAKPANRLETCIRCRRQVTAALTQMTEDGTMCDRCIAGVR